MNKEELGVFDNFLKDYLKSLPFFIILVVVPLCILQYSGFFSTEELKEFGIALFILYLLGEGMCKKALLFIKKIKENKVPDNSKQKLVMKAFNICVTPLLMILLLSLVVNPNFLSNKYIVGLFGLDLLFFIMLFLLCYIKIMSYKPKDNSNK